MYRLILRKGDEIILSPEKFGVASNAMKYATRGNLGEQNVDFIIVDEKDAISITDIEEFEKACQEARDATTQ